MYAGKCSNPSSSSVQRGIIEIDRSIMMYSVYGYFFFFFPIFFFPQVTEVVTTADPEVAFKDADVAILLGGFPRLPVWAVLFFSTNSAPS